MGLGIAHRAADVTGAATLVSPRVVRPLLAAHWQSGNVDNLMNGAGRARFRRSNSCEMTA